ncbi:NUDIX domain-containing protein [Brevibacillus sp. SYP-B805]|uniref:NUDIX hydrolase n=1 Tax=Brevibacillus sp. SYP-B805 TaxID=1578199 RepID=UPI00321731F1
MDDYVKEMRKIIGTRPLLICGASVIIFDRNRHVLMLQRSDNNGWCFPGGAHELGEKIEQTARREVFEETGLTLHDLSLFGVFSGEELHYVYPHGDEVYVVDVVFTANRYEGEISINEESRAYGFFAIDQLPADLSPPVIPIANALIKRFDTITADHARECGIAPYKKTGHPR